MSVKRFTWDEYEGGWTDDTGVQFRSNEILVRASDYDALSAKYDSALLRYDTAVNDLRHANEYAAALKDSVLAWEAKCAALESTIRTDNTATLKAAEERIAELEAFLDRLAFPERYPEAESHTWHSGDGPFEPYAEGVLAEYRAVAKQPMQTGLNMSEWQPIETASQETEIIVYGTNNGDPGMSVASWSWLFGDGRARDVKWWDLSNASGYDMEFDLTPTHWMPLPSPPTPAGCREEKT